MVIERKGIFDIATKDFQIDSYTITTNRHLTSGGGSYRFYARIVCRSAQGDRLGIYFLPPDSPAPAKGIYFLPPDSPAPANFYDPAKKWATIFVPAQFYTWYSDLLRNEKPIFAYLNSDNPEWNQISTTNQFIGEMEPVPDLGSWLASHLEISQAIIWESPNGIQAYDAWTPSMQADLGNAFRMAWHFASVLPVEPVPNKKVLADNDSVFQILDQADAWSMFISLVAQSLAVEIGKRVGWSIMSYSPTGLAQLFDSRETFHWNGAEGGYKITDEHGTVLPCAPPSSYSLLYNLIETNRYMTIAALLEWCRSNLRHFLGYFSGGNVYDKWQYRGFPPVIRMIQGTPTLSQPSEGVSHKTGGCWGTVGFLRAVLRTVNIPVRLVKRCSHALPHFIEDGLYLSHGDDPYGADTKAIPPMPISEILINQAKFDEWFGAGVAAADKCKNIGRRPVELSLVYLPTFLLKAYCRDLAAGKIHGNGEVYDIFKNYYTVAQLEAMNLWGKMDNKISSLGGCNQF